MTEHAPTAEQLVTLLNDEPVTSYHVYVQSGPKTSETFLIVKLPDEMRVYRAVDHEYSLMQQFLKEEREITLLTTEPLIAFILEHV